MFNIDIMKIVLLDFVHRLYYKIIKLKRFGSWTLLPSSGRNGGGEAGQKAYLLGPRVELASESKRQEPYQKVPLKRVD
jgi:hypothetical protein